MLWILPDWLCFSIGLIYIISIVIQLVYRFIKPSHNLYERYGGGWAVVTGGSDGIGLGFSQELSKLGFNVCIISRTKQKIGQACKSLHLINPKIQTRSIVADFSMSMQDGFFEKLVKEIEDLDVSLLVNNVGVLTDIGAFMDNQPEDIRKQCTVNLVPAALLTRHLLPKMLLRQKKSGLIFLSSFSTNFRLKNSSNYCSTKLFTQFLSKSLHYQHPNLDILSLNPGLVTTQMSRNISSFLHVSKNSCARGALKSLGVYGESAGSWWHQLQGIGVRGVGEGVRDFGVGGVWGWIGVVYRGIDQKRRKDRNY